MLRSEDYHAHISKVHRTQSVFTDVPRYPNAHLAFSNQHSHHNTLFNERVEYDETTPETEGGEVVDVEREQCIAKKNKGGFELHKWKTYRP
uniref:Uncharacterized protein n=1 Tax=Glycine max TaxID=3847 RepID=C6TB27_SOYBN|nr:unknown [Glycine max]